MTSLDEVNLLCTSKASVGALIRFYYNYLFIGISCQIVFEFLRNRTVPLSLYLEHLEQVSV